MIFVEVDDLLSMPKRIAPISDALSSTGLVAFERSVVGRCLYYVRLQIASCAR